MVILPYSVFLCVFQLFVCVWMCVCVSERVYSDVRTTDLGPQATADVGPVNIADLVSVEVFIFCVSVS